MRARVADGGGGGKEPTVGATCASCNRAATRIALRAATLALCRARARVARVPRMLCALRSASRPDSGDQPLLPGASAGLPAQQCVAPGSARA